MTNVAVFFRETSSVARFEESGSDILENNPVVIPWGRAFIFAFGGGSGCERMLDSSTLTLLSGYCSACSMWYCFSFR
jgi:hypothetical protein